MRALRHNVGLSQNGLAVAVSTTQKTVTMWENQGTIPNFTKAVILAKTLRVSLKTLAIAFSLDVTGIPDDNPSQDV